MPGHLTTDTAPEAQRFTANAGVQIDATELQSPLDCFSVFFDEDVWKFLVEHTNQYATAYLANKVLKKRSLYINWKPVTVNEMKAFVAMILNMGIIQLPDLKDYRRKDETLNLPFFRNLFTRDRFFQIFNMLHVGDIDSPEKSSKIEPFVQLLLPKFKRAFIPSKQVAVDKSVVTFKGRVSFRQHLKGKPNPWGIKAFMLCESDTGYVVSFSIYYGKDTTLVRPDLPHTVRAVLTVLESLQHKGYDVYVDRFYNSPLLALELLKLGFTVTGTVQSNRKGLPAAIRKKSKADKGSITAYRAGKLMALAWMDKRKVFMLSTKHTKDTQQVTSRRYTHMQTHKHMHTHKATHTDACNVDVYVHLFARLLLHKEYMNTHMHTQIVQTFTQAT